MSKKRKLSSERKKSLRKLANLMNSLNAHPLPITGHLLKCFDIAISPKETDFLLKVNKKTRSYKQLLKFLKLTEEQFTPFINHILKKGLERRWKFYRTTTGDKKGVSSFASSLNLSGKEPDKY
jgi:hypothetical protein